MIAASDNFDTDPLIAERISKGAAYLTPLAEKLMELSRRLSSLKVDVDKESAKVLKRQRHGLLFFAMRVGSAKYTCANWGGGFSVEAWLRRKALDRAIRRAKDTETLSPQPKSKRPEGLTDAQEAYLKEVAPLFSTLVLWRKSKAEERDVPVYTVLGTTRRDRDMRELPRTPTP